MKFEDLKGRRVLVTAASSGIGGAVARAFGAEGAHVAVHYFAGAEAAASVVADIEAAGGVGVAIGGDLRKPAEADRVVAAAAEALGGLDIVVNNCGNPVRRPDVATHTDADLDDVFDLNVRSMLAVTRAAHPHLKAAGDGVVINTASIAGRTGGRKGSALYAGCKAFVMAASKGMAMEFAADGVRVNTVAPGLILTRYHEETSQDWLDRVKASVPLGRLGETDDMIGAYLFLASNRASGYMTGQVLDVNGGRLMP